MSWVLFNYNALFVIYKKNLSYIENTIKRENDLRTFHRVWLKNIIHS